MDLQRKQGFYEKYIKRLLDIICSLLAIMVFSWLFVIIAILVRIKLGKPVLFKQPRPGLIDPKTGKEKIFISKQLALAVEYNINPVLGAFTSLKIVQSELQT